MTNGRGNASQQNYPGELRVVTCRNATSERIPPYGLIELQDGDATTGTGIHTFQAVKPRQSHCQVFANGPVAVKTGDRFQAVRGGRMVIAVNGTAAGGQIWGVKKGSMIAQPNYEGFRILESSSSGYAWAEPIDNALAEYVRRIVVSSGGDTIAVASGGYFDGTLLVKDNDGGYDNDTVPIKILMRGGEYFINGVEIYGTFNGSVEISSVIYSIYHAPGNNRFIRPVCRGGEDVFDAEYYPYPSLIVEDVDEITGEPL